MQIKTVVSAAVLGAASSALALPAAAAAPACFPAQIQQGIQNLLGSVNTVILDLAQERYTVVGSDYSSTGRSLAFLERDILPGGCGSDLPASATTKDQAIAYLQGVQAELNVLAQDAINGDCENGKKSVCRTVNLYGAVAEYIDSVRVTQ